MLSYGIIREHFLLRANVPFRDSSASKACCAVRFAIAAKAAAKRLATFAL